MATVRYRRAAHHGWALVVTLLVGAIVAGCNSGDSSTESAGGQTGSQPAQPPSPERRAEPLEPPEAQESIDDAEQRIGKALASGDCKEINALNPLSRPDQATDERCEYLGRLADLESSGSESYQDAAGVIDYESGRGTATAALVVDTDDLYHIAFVDFLRGEQSAGTGYAGEFDEVAKRAVRALAGGDCDGFLKVAYRRFGRGAGSDKEVCPRVEENLIGNLAEAYPQAEPEKLGGNAGYAFYSYGTPGVHATIALAQQVDSGAAESAPSLPPDAPEYGYVDAYRTNER